ncbi:hypothetical protein C4K37_2531 [Pseudomonas chlororaphis subsp. piscium]|uniref:Uncharacterized protein n=1 Tax=Pseudomonas chlororaphis TaxID=587753 RepID=A0AAX3G840_9PSED|nr:hypothetical protein C4K37_2531 [Pseudomonas chlororaphis subsp. piscium]AZC43463.1 hypothetical protein C4K36_2538 [Pseudomonas chlororaphis subsp. piscium]VEF77812.1 Uncharacterised protein [Pseudomonas chlororaphis]
MNDDAVYLKDRVGRFRGQSSVDRPLLQKQRLI